MDVGNIKLPEQLESYANRMGLWEAAGMEVPWVVNKLSSRGRFLPVTPLSNPRAVAQTVKELTVIFQPQYISEETFKIRVLPNG
jgi:hypothetical protein